MRPSPISAEFAGKESLIPTSTPFSKARRKFIKKESRSVPTTAPERLCIPPTTNIDRVIKVNGRKKVSTTSIPRKWAYKPPPIPTKNALILKEIILWKFIFIPADWAAISSSRVALIAAPNLELEYKNAPIIDYKNISLLKKYISDNGKIISSKITSLSFNKQKKLNREIKKAKILGLI